MIVSSIIFSITTAKIARKCDPCGPEYYTLGTWQQSTKYCREAYEKANNDRIRNTALESLVWALAVCTLWVAIG